MTSITFKNKRGFLLSGTLEQKNTDELLILLHGFASHKNHQLLVDASHYFSTKGISTFRYDVEGAGESQGDFKNSSLQRQVDDLRSALDFVQENYNFERVSVIGFSLGCAVTILCNDPRIERMIFWSPALYLDKDMYPRYTTPKIAQEFEKGYIEREGLRIGQKLIQDFKTVDVLVNVSDCVVPVLFIHGTQDPRIPFESSKIAHKLFTKATLDIIEGANHSFKHNDTHRSKLFDATYKWLIETN